MRKSISLLLLAFCSVGSAAPDATTSYCVFRTGKTTVLLTTEKSQLASHVTDFGRWDLKNGYSLFLANQPRGSFGIILYDTQTGITLKDISGDAAKGIVVRDPSKGIDYLFCAGF